MSTESILKIYYMFFTKSHSLLIVCQLHLFISSTLSLPHIAIIIKSQTVFKSQIGGLLEFLKLTATKDFISDKSKLSKNKSITNFEFSLILFFLFLL